MPGWAMPTYTCVSLCKFYSTYYILLPYSFIAGISPDLGTHSAPLPDLWERGVLVLPQAVPAELWEPASALVHHYLGQPGAIIDGGFDCMGGLVAKYLVNKNWCKKDRPGPKTWRVDDDHRSMIPESRDVHFHGKFEGGPSMPFNYSI